MILIVKHCLNKGDFYKEKKISLSSLLGRALARIFKLPITFEIVTIQNGLMWSKMD